MNPRTEFCKSSKWIQARTYRTLLGFLNFKQQTPLIPEFKRALNNQTPEDTGVRQIPGSYSRN